MKRMHPMALIMGTAGHVDHGKTTLIKALTGTDCDRLKEEKKRGITIELGFTFLDLPAAIYPEKRLGVIDVPGHERFVKNMVAGTGGIDFALLVIAADEGVMPQTREHVEICTLLGVKELLVVLTKVDMVDEDWLFLVQEDVSLFLKTTPFAKAHIIPVSAHTGAGLGTLKNSIAELAASLTPHKRSDLFRLPVDRVFTMKGYGTVVTGTLVAGAVREGEILCLYPGQTTAKVRSLQSHGKTVNKAHAGCRTAVNLAGLEVTDISKGSILAREDTLFPSSHWDVELTCLPSAGQKLKHRKEVHFHHGTKEVPARVLFLDREALAPGETAVVRFQFHEPLAGVYADRIVVRSFSPLKTIAGGRVVNPMGQKITRKNKADKERIVSLTTDDQKQVICTQLLLAHNKGLPLAAMRTMTTLESKNLDKLLQKLLSQGKVFLVVKDEQRYLAGETVKTLCAGLISYIEGFHKNNPAKQGLLRGELASTWGKALSPRILHYIIERTLKTGSIQTSAEIIHLPEHKPSLAGSEKKYRNLILKAYEQAGKTPPTIKEIQKKYHLTPKQCADVLYYLQKEHLLIKTSEDLYFHTSAIQALQKELTDFLIQYGEISASRFKELTGLSRKYLIVLLEYFDKEKITLRIGDVRRLRKQGG